MSIKLASNLFMGSSLNWQAEFYQQLIGSMSNFKELGIKVVKIAEQAQAFRQYDKVKESAQVLINIPIKQYQAIGYYYLGLCEYRSGKNPQEIFERVADDAPEAYRVQALQSLAAIEARKQDYASELRFFIESLKISPSLESLRCIAVIKAKEGYHQSAVKDLEKLYPLAQHAEPITYFQYLNSLAVELGEVGCKNEARNVINHVLASPYAIAYPEWLQTAGDLQQANRSFVAIKTPPVKAANLLSMPATKHAEPTKQYSPARVINLQQWKEKMDKDETPNDRPPNEELDDRELMLSTSTQLD